MSCNDLLSDLILTAATSSEPMTEIRAITLSQLAFEQHYPNAVCVVQPQLFKDGNVLTIALDLENFDDFAHEHVLHALLNLTENVNLTEIDKACLFGKPVVMFWHGINETYVRGTPFVAEHSAV